MGCLVTKKIDFDEEQNFPASIRSAPTASTLGTDLGQVVRVDLDNPPPTGSSELRFSVLVSDPNVTQNLEWQVSVNFTAGLPTAPNGGALLQPNGSVERELDFSLPFSQLSAPGTCSKVELRVSAAFSRSFPFRDPQDSGDIGEAIWWVQVVNNSNTSVDMSTCP